MSFPFKEPNERSGDRFTAQDAHNKRLIVVPIEYVPQVRTNRGDVVDAIRVNVVDLDNGNTTYYGALWFGGNLIGALKGSIGEPFCGYVTKERSAAGFETWKFHSLTQDQYTMQMANGFLAANPTFLETCQGDVNMARAQARAPQQQPQGQPQGDPWAGAMPAPQQQGPPPPPVRQSPPMPQALPQAPVQQSPIPMGATPQAPPPPVPAPPISAPAQTGPPPPPVPEPEQGSVLERLRQRRDAGAAGEAQYQQPGQMPF